MTIIKSGATGMLRGFAASVRNEIGVCALALALLLGAGTALAGDSLDRLITLDIPAYTHLDDALIDWGTKTGVTVMINTETADHHLTPKIKGTLSARKALTWILRDTGLSYAEGGGTVRIVPTSSLRNSSFKGEEFAPAPLGEDRTMEAGGAAGGGADSGGDSAAGRPAGLAEVVVTAEKRTERIQDVPIPVTAVSAESLTEQNQLLVRDFASSVPGLSISPAGNYQTLAIRGITTGYNTSPTVGVTIDDVPYGSSGNNGAAIPDIDPGNLQRIEVLRGPQGTLYGANAMGGLLKFVTLDPSTDALTGSVQAGVNTVHNGPGAGYTFRGAVNIPVTDTLAVRISGFTREDPGYIDNVISNKDGVNEDHAAGGLITALWKPSDAVSLKLNALYQRLRAGGAYEVEKDVNNYAGPPLGDLQQSYIPGIGAYDRETQFYSANLNVKLGLADLTSVTGYNVNTYANESDATYRYGVLVGAGDGASIASAQTTQKFSQELRLAVPIGDRFQWLLGGFYTSEHADFAQSILAVDANTGTTVENDLFNYDDKTWFTEHAVFTNFTYQFTDNFDLQAGGRESWAHGVGEPTLITGLLVGGVSHGTTSTDDASKFTYQVTPRFKISPDLMVYARVASGYQFGGKNTNGPVNTPLYDPNLPDRVQSSNMVNYEIGFKGDVLDHVLSFDTSLYYIDWTKLQINALSPINGFNYSANASAAKSDGVEISITARPLTGLTIAGWGAYDQAVLTQDFPSVSTLYGKKGDRLPYSSRFSANLAIDQEVPLTGSVTGFGGATASYVGDRVGTFIATPTREIYPAYTRVDLRAGVTYQSWRAELYVANVGDVRGELGGGQGTFPPFAFIYITPRTIGLNLSRKF